VGKRTVSEGGVSLCSDGVIEGERNERGTSCVGGEQARPETKQMANAQREEAQGGTHRRWAGAVHSKKTEAVKVCR
jgi:hypothetical protein